MQNFGKIKNAFNSVLVEGIVGKNDSNKSTFKKYISTIKENEILRTQFLVYNNIENKLEEDNFKANNFIHENVKLMNKFSKKEISEANLKLAKLISFDDSEVSYPNDKLHEDISKLIFTERTPSTINSIVESVHRIMEYIKDNKKENISEPIDLPTSMISTLMVDKYNEKYSTLDESEKQILKAIIDSNDEQKKEVYTTTIRECIDLINDRLNTSDLEAKDKLLRVKDKLLNDKIEINEDFEKKISKLVELKSSLV